MFKCKMQIIHMVSVIAFKWRLFFQLPRTRDGVS